jgi:hypothetical protein
MSEQDPIDLPAAWVPQPEPVPAQEETTTEAERMAVVAALVAADNEAALALTESQE